MRCSGARRARLLPSLLASRGIEVLDLDTSRRVRPRLPSLSCPRESVPAGPGRRTAAPPRTGPSRACPTMQTVSSRSTPSAGFTGFTDLYAAGDMTAGSIKQGGVATQQADTVAIRDRGAIWRCPSSQSRSGRCCAGRSSRATAPGSCAAEVDRGRRASAPRSARRFSGGPEGKIAGRHLSHVSRPPGPRRSSPDKPLTADAIPVDVDLPGDAAA